MPSALKMRLDVDEHTAAVLDGQSRIANWLCNRLLEEANELRRRFRETRDPEAARVLYTERDWILALKQEHPFLRTVYSSVLKNAALRVSRAIREYQKGRHGKRAGKVNWPTFRSWKRKWFSLLYDEPWKGFRLEGRTLVLSLGMALDEATGQRKRVHVSTRLAEPLPDWFEPGMVRQLRIVKGRVVVLGRLHGGAARSFSAAGGAGHRHRPEPQELGLRGGHRWRGHGDLQSVVSRDSGPPD